jgi:ABC-type multidrug transport system fused ATPase/permease subunit
MLAFVRPYWRRLLAAFVLMLASTALTLLTPYLIKVTIDGSIASGDGRGLAQMSAVIAVCYLGLYLATAGQEYLMGRTSERVLADLRQRLFRHLQSLSLSFHDRTIVGVTVSHVINDVAVINNLLTQGFISLLGDLLVLVGIVAIMLSMSARLALLTFAVLPLMALATYLFSSSRSMTPIAGPISKPSGFPTSSCPRLSSLEPWRRRSCCSSAAGRSPAMR